MSRNEKKHPRPFRAELKPWVLPSGLKTFSTPARPQRDDHVGLTKKKNDSSYTVVLVDDPHPSAMTAHHAYVCGFRHVLLEGPPCMMVLLGVNIKHTIA